MRAVVLRIALALVLVAPTAAAFVSGGYFDQARLVLALGAWVLVAVVAVMAPVPLPASRPGRLAAAGLVLLATWVLASVTWAPIPGPAWHDAQRVALYAGGLLAAHGLLSRRTGRLAVEPALVGGALVVALYALSERFLPGLVQFEESRSALGRLNQPLTYWNAEGSVMAVALVLALRLGGTPERPRTLRVAALAGAPWLALALYLSLSRGALAALAIGVLTVLLLDHGRAQLRAVAAGVAASLPVVAASEIFTGVQGTDGSGGDGLAVLAVALLASAVAAVAGARWVRPARAPRPSRLRVSPAMGAALVLGVIALGAAVTVAGGGEPPEAPGPRADAGRLQSLGSNRGDYWRVALSVASEHPLVGHGSGSFEVDWSRERTIAEGVRDAHSLVLETAAELGLVGLVLLAMFLAGVAACVPVALRRDPVVAVGAVGGLVAWILHAQLDWLWEMPAATLNALILAALLLALADPVDQSDQSDGGQEHDHDVGGVA